MKMGGIGIYLCHGKRHIDMTTFTPLVQFNPSGIDISMNHSYWIAARGLKPGIGNSLISCPHYVTGNYMGMRTMTEQDIKTALTGYTQGELIGMTALGTLEPIIYWTFEWRGMWGLEFNSTQYALLGWGNDSEGLIYPFNTFNAGYQWRRRSWRPQYVN